MLTEPARRPLKTDTWMSAAARVHLQTSVLSKKGRPREHTPGFCVHGAPGREEALRKGKSRRPTAPPLENSRWCPPRSRVRAEGCQATPARTAGASPPVGMCVCARSMAVFNYVADF